MRNGILIFIVAVLLPAGVSRGQAPATAPGTFPDALLDGMAPFTFGLQFFSDVRGNVGPCG